MYTSILESVCFVIRRAQSNDQESTTPRVVDVTDEPEPERSASDASEENSDTVNDPKPDIAKRQDGERE